MSRASAVRMAIAIGLAALGTSRAAGADVAVVAHPSVPVNELSFVEMRKVLLGDRQFWTSNLRVTLLLRAPVAPERDVILKTVYQMSEAQFRQYWIGKVFRAEVASGPRIVHSHEEAAQQAAATPGAVTFVDGSRIPRGLKVLKIDGRSPGDPGYRLR